MADLDVCSLFELVKGELVEIVDYAFEHHRETGRAPKLAVNASSWWYANMTRATVQEIRNRTKGTLFKFPNWANWIYAN